MEPTADFNPKTAAKKLLREGRSGALATLMPGSGDPYCSLVNVATAADGAPLLLISRLAIHTKNVLADHRVSLMIDERKEGDPLQGGRIMMIGTAAVTDDPNARRRYLDRQPEAEMFASFADFSSGRREHDFIRMLANLLAHRVDLNKGAIYGLGPGNFAGHPNGKENRAEVAFAHAGNVDAPGSTALAKIELAVKKALRRVVVRVHDDGGEVQLPRFFRNGIGGDGKTHKTCNGNPHNG